MPSVSKAQQRWAAIAEHDPGALRGPRPSMTRAQLHEFAATRTADLPEHVRHRYAHGGEVGAVPSFAYHHLRMGYQALPDAVRGFQGGGKVEDDPAQGGFGDFRNTPDEKPVRRSVPSVPSVPDVSVEELLRGYRGIEAGKEAAATQKLLRRVREERSREWFAAGGKVAT